MSDSAPPPDTDPPAPPAQPAAAPPTSTPTPADAAFAAIPQALPAPPRRWWNAAQAIWLIPLVAVLVVGWLGMREYLARGPTVTVRFASGEGIEAGKTRIKYRNVDVGQVTKVGLARDLKGVVVTAEMAADASRLLVDDTRFWVVRPRVIGGEISGLATLLSGAFIGIDGGKSSSARRDFVGLETQPVISLGEAGTEYVLHGSSLGSLDIGSPVFFRRVRVGQVMSTELERDGGGLRVRVFVRAPYDRFVSVDTRFWHSSGIDVSADAGGVRLRTESLLSVLVGGLAFETPSDLDDSERAAPGAQFKLFDSNALAMRRGGAQILEYTALFSESVRGLAVGAPIEFKGFVIGEVGAVDISYRAEQGDFVFPVKLHIYKDVAPLLNARESARSAPAEGAATERRFPIERLLSPRSIAKGLRAQLRSANLLTGQRYVAIDMFPHAPQRDVALAAAAGARFIPTAPETIGELQAQLARIVTKIEAVPFDRIADDLRRTLGKFEAAAGALQGTLDKTTQQTLPGAQQALDELRATLREVRTLLARNAPLPQEIGGAVHDLSRAADAIRELAETLERQPESLLRGKRGNPGNATNPAHPADPNDPSQDARR